MASTQQILSAITGMQADAQEALPVHPNNGNPGGAYNMPVQKAEGGGSKEAPDPLAFLKPSESMNRLKGLLAQRKPMLTQRLESVRRAGGSTQ